MTTEACFVFILLQLKQPLDGFKSSIKFLTWNFIGVTILVLVEGLHCISDVFICR